MLVMAAFALLTICRWSYRRYATCELYRLMGSLYSVLHSFYFKPRVRLLEAGEAPLYGFSDLAGLLPPRALQSGSSLDFIPCQGSSLSVLQRLPLWVQAAQPLGFAAESLSQSRAFPCPCFALGYTGPLFQAPCTFSGRRAHASSGVFPGLIGAVLARGLREVSVALGPPPRLLPFPQHLVSNPAGSTIFPCTHSAASCPAALFGVFKPQPFSPPFGSSLASAPAPMQSIDGVAPCPSSDACCELSKARPSLFLAPQHFCRGQREISVALGSPPADVFLSLLWDLVVFCAVQGGSLSAAFLFTLAALHLLVLWRLLVCASPGGRSPLKSLMHVPCAKVPTALVLPWGYTCCPAYAATVEPKARRRALGQRPLPFWFRVLALLGSLPVPVWGVPQDIASALTEAHAAVTPDPARSGSDPADNGPLNGRTNSHSDSPYNALRPDDLSAHGHTSAGSSQDVSARDYRAAVEADIAARGSSSCLQAQPGLCIQSPGINVPARVTLCVPGHRMITSEIMLTLPATLEDFVDRVYEAAPSPLDDCWNLLIPATPQLNDGAATLRSSTQAWRRFSSTLGR